MKSNLVVRRLGGALLFVSTLAVALPRADAQTTTGSVRGFVRTAAGAPVPSASVAARNPQTNLQRGALTANNGFYQISGLRPGGYEVTVRRIGFSPQTRTIQLLIGQTLDVNFTLTDTAVQLAAVQVVATAPAAETKTSEVATNVTREQVNNLPTSSRNFLDLAQLAPGTRVTPDRINGAGKSFAAGALPAENINVFIDGASYKNDIINGGVAGQDASRGNPFPRNAIQEFRIATTNFKAEYQKASSAIITAITRSGTNQWEGSAFVDYQNQDLVALDTFARAQKDTAPATFIDPDYRRYLLGLSAGGPLVRDKLFFFGAYEGNYQNRTGVVRLQGDPATWPPAIAPFENETHVSPFRSSLFFGKLSYNFTDNQELEFTGDFRHETDKRHFGGQFGDQWEAFEAGENFKNDVATARLKHSYTGSDWLNEAFVAYQWYAWHPDPFNYDLPGQDYVGIGRIGGRDSRQDLVQKRLSLRNDFTYNGWQIAGSHVVKVGANVDFVNYDFDKDIFGNPLFHFSASNNYAFPVSADYGVGNGNLSTDNTQLGIYAQDDWSPTSRLTLNLGVRWDYESGMYNRDYVTPQPVIDSLTLYRDSLRAVSGIDIDPGRYFTDGNDREAFLGAWQPRVGLSYALDEAARTTVFAGFGIFYDRLEYNATFDETYRRQHPQYVFTFDSVAGPGVLQWSPSLFSRQGLDSVLASGQAPPQEVFLIPNDLKPPRTNQWSVGVRHDFGLFNASATYTGVRGYDGFTYEWANLTLNPATNDCCLSVTIPAYRNVLVANNHVRSWYNALLLQLDRPYRRTGADDWGWGAGISYTLSKAEAEGSQGGQPTFTFPQVDVGFNGRHPIDDDRRHNIVVNWITDIPYLWGIQFSGLAQFASGTPFDRIAFVDVGGTTQQVLLGRERSDWFKNIDIRVRKDFPNVAGTRLGVTASLFNVFNWQNLGTFDETFIRSDLTPNPNFGHASTVISDPRRFQIGLQYDFALGAQAGGPIPPGQR